MSNWPQQTISTQQWQSLILLLSCESVLRSFFYARKHSRIYCRKKWRIFVLISICVNFLKNWWFCVLIIITTYTQNLPNILSLQTASNLYSRNWIANKVSVHSKVPHVTRKAPHLLFSKLELNLHLDKTTTLLPLTFFVRDGIDLSCHQRWPNLNQTKIGNADPWSIQPLTQKKTQKQK